LAGSGVFTIDDAPSDASVYALNKGFIKKFLYQFEAITN
jgi:hypothetical protein